MLDSYLWTAATSSAVSLMVVLVGRRDQADGWLLAGPLLLVSWVPFALALIRSATVRHRSPRWLAYIPPAAAVASTLVTVTVAGLLVLTDR